MDCKQLRNVEEGARVWSEKIAIPTYSVGKPSRNPMFLEKRVYQGSSGRVYPHPVIEKIYDEKQTKEYNALCMENRYLFVMVLPELGGRIQRAYDKTNGYDFVYYNQVIKPALVGLAGPWISGGIEFNWPQHHRPSTFDPVDGRFMENPDGSCSIVVSETERMSRTTGTATMTLFPDTAYIRIDIRLYNGTAFPQSFLWWANPAVAANDDSRSVFPPDVTAVMDHGKRDVSSFPIATGVYYKQDYSPGVDISRFKNLKVPTSYMAYRSKYDFIGGYDEGRRAGLLHVADHHISPGKKQWTWGCGDFGRAWDRNLTDEDGPYVELMTGCYTDNQPDFSWLMPYEEKTFTQYFMPYKEIGTVKNASAEAAVALALEDGAAKISVYATALRRGVRIVLLDNAREAYSAAADISPDDVFSAEARVNAEHEWELELRLLDGDGTLLLAYRPEKPANHALPEPAAHVPLPENAATNEDLYLYGLHLEQYRHATYLPEDYYLEGLRRDPTDARINNAYGLLLMRSGRFADAEGYFLAAVGKLTRSNPNPYDGEPYYNLGVCLRYLDKPDEAYDSLYKAAWNAAQQANAYYAMACLRAQSGQMKAALEHAESGLVRSAHNMRARTLKCALLRKLGSRDKAAAYARESLEINPSNLAAQYELSVLTDEERWMQALKQRVSSNPDWAIELALEYGDAGFADEALDILGMFCEGKDAAKIFPMVIYYQAYFAECAGKRKEAAQYRKQAACACGDYCFPNRLDDLVVLQSSLEAAPDDAKGWYYLGNLWYDKRQYENAIAAWERSRSIDAAFPTVRRNLSLAYYNKRSEKEAAAAEMEKAFALDTGDARVLMELDQLRKRTGMPPQRRIEQLEKHMKAVADRDDLFVEYIALQNMTKHFGEALGLIEGRRFHPWEGGEGKVAAQYVYALMGLAVTAIREKRFGDAIEMLKRAVVYPENIGEGKLENAKENNVYYWMGVAYRGNGDEKNARTCFERAAQGEGEPAGMMYYNDQPPEMIFYQGLALRELHRGGEASACFDKLTDYARTHMRGHVHIDFFAVSLPDLLVFDEGLDARNRLHCLFMEALGLMGRGEKVAARERMDEVLAADPNHQGVVVHRDLLSWML